MCCTDGDPLGLFMCRGLNIALRVAIGDLIVQMELYIVGVQINVCLPLLVFQAHGISACLLKLRATSFLYHLYFYMYQNNLHISHAFRKSSLEHTIFVLRAS